MAAMGGIKASAEKTDAPRHATPLLAAPLDLRHQVRLRRGGKGERMSEVEGIGELVTGAAIAAAVEPTAGGEAVASHGNCLNCSTPLFGAYCSACGQKARVHRSLRSFFGDLMQGLFNFEGKICRTLPMLAWRPGEMTRRYVEGERARFVSPVALYLFTVFAMFAVLNFTGAMTGDLGNVNSPLNGAAAETRGQLAELEAERRVAVAAKSDLALIDKRIANKKQGLANIERMQRGQVVYSDDGDANGAPRWLQEAGLRIQSDPKAFVAKVQDAASKFSWLLIPLSVPFLWLLFPFNRRYHLYDHTVFVTYSLSFMMMLAIAAGLLVSAGLVSIASLLFFLPPIHMYRQLRGAYRLGRFSALVRTFLLVTFACVAATLFLMVVFAIGAL